MICVQGKFSLKSRTSLNATLCLPQSFARRRALALLPLAWLVVSCSGTTEPKTPPAVVASIEVKLTPELLAVGKSALAVATAKDLSGQVIRGAPIVWTAGSGATVTAAGVVTATRTGYSSVRASAGASTGSVYGDKLFRIVPLPATRLSAYRLRLPLVRSGAPNTFDGESFVAALLDSTGTLVPNPGVVVTASVVGATVSGTTSATTDANGYAVFTNLVITGSSGAKTLQLSSPGFPGATLPFTLTSGVPASIKVLNGANQIGVSGWGTDAISVLVSDAEGNPVPRVSATFAVTSGNGRIIVGSEPTSSVQPTDWDGVAGIPSWRLGTFGTNTLSITVPGITPTIISATAQHRIVSATITFAQMPIRVGQSVQTSVSAIDENGAPFIPSDFADWYIVGDAASITRTGIVTGVRAGTGTVYVRIQGATAQAPYTVTGVATSKLVIASPLSGLHVGGKLAVQPALQIVDAVTGAPIPEAGRAITVVHSSNLYAPTTLSGTLTVFTDATGTARFTDLAVVGASSSFFGLDFLSERKCADIVARSHQDAIDMQQPQRAFAAHSARFASIALRATGLLRTGLCATGLRGTKLRATVLRAAGLRAWTLRTLPALFLLAACAACAGDGPTGSTLDVITPVTATVDTLGRRAGRSDRCIRTDDSEIRRTTHCNSDGQACHEFAGGCAHHSGHGISGTAGYIALF